MGSRPASKKASPKSIPRPMTATAGGGGPGGGGGAGVRGGGAGGGGSERSDDTRGRRSLRPSPEWNGYAPERPHKKQRTGRSKEDVPEQTGLMRAGWEILRPGLMPQTDVRSFVAPDRVSPQYRPADEDGYYVYELGENISTRYKILARIGEGSFGRVLECWDRKERSFVAIKVIRNIDKYRHAAMIEIEVLNTVQKNDPTGKRHCIALKEWFEYRGHVCMVFDRFGPSLYDFLRRNDYKAFPCFLVQHFGRIILEAVAYLHEIKLVHTDLKPENILLDRDGIQKISEADSAATYGRINEALKEEQRCKMMKIPSTRRLHIIDFGSATFNDQYHSSLVSTRHYRAPEVVLGLGWSYPCDIWSVGCILTELITGDALFQTHENLEHLAMMEVVVDKPVPSSMVRKSSKTAKKYFNDDGQLIWPTSSTNRKSMRAVYRLRPIKNYLVDFGHRSVWPVLDTLVDLLVRMLEFEPEQRITARQALEHPFFKMTNGAA